MSATINLQNTSYNKDEVWAKLSIENGFEATIDEAVAIDCDENKFILFAYISSAAGVKNFGDKEYSYKATPCKIEIPKKEHKGYGDKDVTPNALHSVLNYVVTNDIGFGKPFKAELTGANSKLQELVLTGKKKDKEVSKEDILATIKGTSCEYEPIEALDKLKDLKMDAPKSFQRSGGMAPGKILDARLEWIDLATKDDSKFRTVAESLGVSKEDQSIILTGYLEKLFN